MNNIRGLDANKNVLGTDSPLISSSSFSSQSQPIMILNDENFTDYGFSGLGTEEHPYIIEEVIISNKSVSNGVVVINTTKHFIIQKCYFKVYYSAIYIKDIAEGTALIRNNFCNYSDVGIVIINSKEVNIVENRLTKNIYGVYAINSDKLNILNNTCDNNFIGDIHVEDSSYTKIFNNECSNSSSGFISVENSFDYVINNTFLFNSVNGVYLYNEESIFQGNNCSNNYNGMWIKKTTNSIIRNNYFTNNKENGCLVTKGSYSNFTENTFENNTKYGLFFDDKNSFYNLIHHNKFINNNVDGTSQAKDDGRENIWYDVKTEEGNYWSDWNKKKPYLIDGSANSEDTYPLDEKLERVNYSIMLFIPSIIIVAILHKNYKKKKAI